jgi:hypothetical protein
MLLVLCNLAGLELSDDFSAVFSFSLQAIYGLLIFFDSFAVFIAFLIGLVALSLDEFLELQLLLCEISYLALQGFLGLGLLF